MVVKYHHNQKAGIGGVHFLFQLRWGVEGDGMVVIRVPA
jgi:hypothetical protein